MSSCLLITYCSKDVTCGLLGLFQTGSRWNPVKVTNQVTWMYNRFAKPSPPYSHSKSPALYAKHIRMPHIIICSCLLINFISCCACDGKKSRMTHGRSYCWSGFKYHHPLMSPPFLNPSTIWQPSPTFITQQSSRRIHWIHQTLDLQTQMRWLLTWSNNPGGEGHGGLMTCKQTNPHMALNKRPSRGPESQIKVFNLKRNFKAISLLWYFQPWTPKSIPFSRDLKDKKSWTRGGQSELTLLGPFAWTPCPRTGCPRSLQGTAVLFSTSRGSQVTRILYFH